jgi:hypothetical protein
LGTITDIEGVGDVYGAKLKDAGIAGQHSDRLEAAGVDTVVELANRNP